MLWAGTGLFLAGNNIFFYGCDQNKEKTRLRITKNRKYKRVITLGMDGLDPKTILQLMGQGEMPNFSRFSKTGHFSPLGTSNPAHSPTAWASIATGNNPGYHGIFDFLNRRVDDYMPELAIFKRNPSNLLGSRNSMFLPVMQGETFWDYTSSEGIPSTILKWPVTFQPKKNAARLFSGLGVPSLRGRLGNYSFYTTAQVPKDDEGAEKVTTVSKNGNNIKTYIKGPKVSPDEDSKTDLNITLLDGDSRIKVEADGKAVIVNKQQWSDWLEVKFKVGMLKTVSGIVKFYLNSVSPEFELYMTPIQINPKDPAFIISNPDEYIKELADELGYFYTIGIPEDTRALTEGRLDDEAFISMCDEITKEREGMLWHELNKFKEGLFSLGFFSTDRIQHMFWATKDPLHPQYNETYARKFGHVIDDYYRRMDRILGEVMKNVDESTAIMTFSDHGFSSFRRGVHLNSWLVENGFMKLDRKVDKKDKEGGSLFNYVDWENTYAYALGFGSIYLNMKGREKHGIVAPGAQSRAVLKDISGKLIKLHDSRYGQSSVKNVYMSDNIYSGGHIDKSPDIVVGFNEGYRASWQTALGGSPSGIIEDNATKWSGDHIVDPSIVPGFILTNFKTNHDNPNLMDIAPTVLSCFGMSTPDIEGKTLI